MPWLAQVGLTVVLIILWQAFAFFAAVLLEEAEWRGRELAVRNGELLATQTMLSESAKMGERLRIAGDLHDSAGHLLTALSVNLQLASRLVDGPGAEQVRRAHVVARTLLGEVRETAGTMRQLTAAVVRPAVHVEISEGLTMADPARAHALFRCVQEMLTNTMRHGEAKNLWLRVGLGDGTVKVEARDDGRGCGGD